MCASSVITVSGLSGSGTSTVCELVAERSGFRYINAGAIFRTLAGKDDHGVSPERCEEREFCSRSESLGTRRP